MGKLTISLAIFKTNVAIITRYRALFVLVRVGPEGNPSLKHPSEKDMLIVPYSSKHLLRLYLELLFGV